MNDIQLKESIGSYISSFHRIGASFLAQKFEEYDIGVGQYQFLIKLYLKDGISHEQLTKLVHVDKATTTRAVTKLYENGFVTVEKSDTDRRKSIIYLTEYAKSIKDHIWDIAGEWENQLTQSLTVDEFNQLYSIFSKIAENNLWLK